MDLLKEVREISEVVRQSGNEGLYERLVSIRAEILDIQEKLFNNKKLIKELEEALALKQKLTFVEPAYYEMDKEGKPTGKPYCQTCFEGKGKAIHLVYRDNHDTDQGECEYWMCYTCEKGFMIPLGTPIRKYVPPEAPRIKPWQAT